MVLLGAGRHAKEVIEALLLLGWRSQDLLCFADFSDKKSVCGIRITTSKDDATKHNEFIIATGSSSTREVLFEQGISWRLIPTSIIASTASVSNQSLLEPGLNIMEFVYVGPNATINTGALLNTASSIHHDVSIGEFCEIAPGVRVLGGAVIGRKSLIGANAVILPDIKVGEGCIIGAGAVVTTDIPPYSAAVGVPAKIIKILVKQ